MTLREKKKELKRQDLYRLLLELYETCGFKPIHYIHQRNMLSKYKCSFSTFSLATKLGITEQVKRGYIGFTKVPTKDDADKIYNEHLKCAKEGTIRSKHKKEKQGKFTSNTINFPTTISTEDAVKHLKSLGYKIMKPIQPQYEEI